MLFSATKGESYIGHVNNVRDLQMLFYSHGYHLGYPLGHHGKYLFMTSNLGYQPIQFGASCKVAYWKQLSQNLFKIYP